MKKYVFLLLCLLLMSVAEYDIFARAFSTDPASSVRFQA